MPSTGLSPSKGAYWAQHMDIGLIPTSDWVGLSILDGLLCVAHERAREHARVDALLLPHVHAVCHTDSQPPIPAGQYWQNL